MSSEKVVQEDLRKLLQKVPASYHLYIFLQLIDEKNLRFTTFSIFFFVSEPVTHTIVMYIMQAENGLKTIVNEVFVPSSKAVQYSTKIQILHAIYKYVCIWMLVHRLKCSNVKHVFSVACAHLKQITHNYCNRLTINSAFKNQTANKSPASYIPVPSKILFHYLILIFLALKTWCPEIYMPCFFNHLFTTFFIICTPLSMFIFALSTRMMLITLKTPKVFCYLVRLQVSSCQ